MSAFVAAPKKRPRKPPSHSWRAHEEERPGKKFQRQFHGARRDDETPRQRPADDVRAEVLTDRKGRILGVDVQTIRASAESLNQGGRAPAGGMVRGQRKDLLCHRALMDDRPRYSKAITQLAKASRKERLFKRHVDLSILGEKLVYPLSLFRGVHR